jgi:hypothetical protein
MGFIIPWSPEITTVFFAKAGVFCGLARFKVCQGPHPLLPAFVQNSQEKPYYFSACTKRLEDFRIIRRRKIIFFRKIPEKIEFFA